MGRRSPSARHLDRSSLVLLPSSALKVGAPHCAAEKRAALVLPSAGHLPTPLSYCVAEKRVAEMNRNAAHALNSSCTAPRGRRCVCVCVCVCVCTRVGGGGDSSGCFVHVQAGACMGNTTLQDSEWVCHTLKPVTACRQAAAHAAANQ